MAWYDKYDQTPTPREYGPIDTSQAQTATSGANDTQAIQQATQQFLAGKDPTPENFQALVQYLQGQGFNVQVPPRPAGGLSSDKLILPNGEVFDVIKDVGGPGASWTWNLDSYWVDGKGSATPGVYTPFSSSNAAPGSLGALGYGAGSAVAPWTKEFTSPSAAQVEQFPGFQYGQEQAQQAIERSAAAKGTLLTGGTLQRLTGNAIDQGMLNYGQARDWMRDDYLIGRENFYGNQDRPFEKFYSLSALGRPQ